MAKIKQYGKQLSSMTEQQVFNVACEHLLSQMQQATVSDVREGNICAYKGENGNCCVAAPFLTKYSKQLEGLTWDECIECGYAYNKHAELIYHLQEIHDMIKPYNWIKGLKRVANIHELDDSILNTIYE
jgi:hypothetical protein